MIRRKEITSFCLLRLCRHHGISRTYTTDRGWGSFVGLRVVESRVGNGLTTQRGPFSKASPTPHCIVTACCAMFKVTREAVLRRTMAVYKALQSFVAKGGPSGQTACHKLEHLWQLIFGASAWQHPVQPRSILSDGVKAAVHEMRRRCGPDCVPWAVLQERPLEREISKAMVEVVQAAPNPLIVHGHLCDGKPCRYVQHSAQPLLRALERSWPNTSASFLCDAENRTMTPERLYILGLQLLWHTLDGDSSCQLDRRSSAGGPTCDGQPILEDETSLQLWSEMLAQREESGLHQSMSRPHRIGEQASNPQRAQHGGDGRAYCVRWWKARDSTSQRREKKSTGRVVFPPGAARFRVAGGTLNMSRSRLSSAHRSSAFLPRPRMHHGSRARTSQSSNK